MVRETTALVERRLAEGKTVDQLSQENVLAPWEARWGKGFICAESYLEQIDRRPRKAVR